MPRTQLKQILRALPACMAVAATPSIAAEGGVTHYMPGAMATLTDLAPTQPGWVTEMAFLHYEGEAEASRRLPVAGELVAGLDACSDALLLGGFYTFDQPVLGARYSVGGFLPYV